MFIASQLHECILYNTVTVAHRFTLSQFMHLGNNTLFSGHTMFTNSGVHIVTVGKMIPVKFGCEETHNLNINFRHKIGLIILPYC